MKAPEGSGGLRAGLSGIVEGQGWPETSAQGRACSVSRRALRAACSPELQ